MNITSTKTFRAEATFGLKKGYTMEMISIEKFKTVLECAQKKIASEMDLKLSAKITSCSILFLGQDEPSVSLKFIQYPKFPSPEEKLKQGIVRLVEFMMNELNQNRVVVEFDDETIMLEEDGDLLDPNISTNS